MFQREAKDGAKTRGGRMLGLQGGLCDQRDIKKRDIRPENDWGIGPGTPEATGGTSALTLREPVVSEGSEQRTTPALQATGCREAKTKAGKQSGDAADNRRAGMWRGPGL